MELTITNILLAGFVLVCFAIVAKRLIVFLGKMIAIAAPLVVLLVLFLLFAGTR